MAKKVKRFEAFLGTEFKAWMADDKTSISQSDGNVVVKTVHPEHGTYTTHFQLDLIPAYTIQ